jgi:hypothetical protein
MGEQIFVKIRKTLAVLLAVVFLMTVISMAVSAVQDNFNPSGTAD